MKKNNFLVFLCSSLCILLCLIFVSCDSLYETFLLGQAAIPVNVSAKLLPDNTVLLSWDYNARYRNFYIYSSADDAEFQRLAYTETKYYNDKKIKPGVKYSYYIIADMEHYTDSKASDVVSIDIPAFSSSDTYLAAPQNLTAQNGKTSKTIVLSWEPVPGATCYEIYFSKDNFYTRNKFQTKSPVTETTYTLTGVAECADYYFFVRAVDSNGIAGNLSERSNMISTPEITHSTFSTAYELKKNTFEYFYNNYYSKTDNSKTIVKIKTDMSGNADLLYNSFNYTHNIKACYSVSNEKIPDESFSIEDNIIHINGMSPEEELYLIFEIDYSSVLFFIYQL